MRKSLKNLTNSEVFHGAIIENPRFFGKRRALCRRLGWDGCCVIGRAGKEMGGLPAATFAR
jgi:hypothetical protein